MDAVVLLLVVYGPIILAATLPAYSFTRRTPWPALAALVAPAAWLAWFWWLRPPAPGEDALGAVLGTVVIVGGSLVAWVLSAMAGIATVLVRRARRKAP